MVAVSLALMPITGVQATSPSFPVSGIPSYIEFDQVHDLAYVGLRGGPGDVAVIDPATNGVLGTVSSLAFDLAVDATTGHAYVANGFNTIDEIDGVSQTIVRSIPTTYTANAITVAGTLGTFYFAAFQNQCCGRPTLRHLYVADLTSGEILAHVQGQEHIQDLAVDETEGFLYVAMNDGVHVLDALTLAPVTVVSQPTASVALAADPTAGRVYSLSDDADIPVLVIDTATNTEVASLPGDDYGFGIAVDPTRGRVFVARVHSDTRGRLDTYVADVLVGSLPLGTQPRSVAVREATGDAWIGDDIDLDITVVAGIDGDAASGSDSVTTDKGDGATAADPVATTVTSPFAGPITINEGGGDTAAPSGYSFFGMQVDVSAPAATAAQPLELRFLLDEVVLPAGATASTVDVFRNGVLVGDCTGPAGQAVPSPCVSSRGVAGDDLEIVVLTAAASAWNFGVTVPVNDTTPPAVTIVTPADGAGYTLGSSVEAEYDCQDEPGGSGLASCVGPVIQGAAIDTATIGPKTFRVDASDAVGNSSTLTHSYAVVWPFAFAKPIDPQPAVNKVKAGDVAAIKFTLGGDRGLAVFLAGSPGSGPTACVAGAPLGTVVPIDKKTGLAYQKATKTYLIEWKTDKTWANTCRRLELRLADGSVKYADFKFTK